ncbi:hypothetical protein HYALB_00013333 [Hymenoscyphus albidus]|uniref:histidine kinase n=1 Tax=Hymenoscyphus albidus TaxID=595503 RepID=A0A9N9LSW6_9HELO|nr:hypothetical protein HYALB_00013333 [Hymenoscyphus albidus]
MVQVRTSDNRRLGPKQILATSAVQSLIRYYTSHCNTRQDFWTDKSFVPLKTCISSTPSPINHPHQHTSSVDEVLNGSQQKADPLQHDPTLSALAQLGALQLNCQRAFISLIDHQNQYVLAEATRSISLDCSKQSRSADGLYLGAQLIDLESGICPESIHVFMAEDNSRDILTPNIRANRTLYTINDLSIDNASKEKEFVVGWPHMRFYAEVPIKTSSGILIGSYCVVDNKPRRGLDSENFRKLKEIASVVTRHLELVQAHKNLERSRDMVKALGLFVEGKPSLREWWTDAFNVESGCTNVESLQSKDGDRSPPSVDDLTVASDKLENFLRVESFLKSASDYELRPKEASTRSSSPDEIKSTAATVSNRAPESRADSLGRPGTVALTPSISEIPNPTKEEKDLIQQYRPSTTKLAQQDLMSYASIKALFSRASHLIRDASDLDGILFVSASLQNVEVKYAKSSVTTNTPQTATTPSRVVSDTQSSASAQSSRNGQTKEALSPGSFTISIGRTASNHPGTDHKLSTCDILGYSIDNKGCGGGLEPAGHQLNIPQSVLRGLLSNYPHGNIFLFDEDSSPFLYEDIDPYSTSGETRKPESASKRRLRKFEREKQQMRSYQLLDICPGARAIIFFPLWDPQRDQWFAGSLAWTRDPWRILHSEDVTYLAGFGSCIMAEKSKMDALTADRSKADFISSISHELRTPLHGLLATLDIIDGISRNDEEDELIRTMTTCGEVLLDTMDHILDYARMSAFRKNQIPKSEKKQDPGALVLSNGITSFDFSNMVESVVEGVLAGHRYRSVDRRSKSSVVIQEDTMQQKNFKPTPPGINPDVMVVLNIQKQPSWLFESQIGAWKRILTNVFGNALKYTDAGFIKVSLRLEALPERTQPKGVVSVVLEIEDTGIGMSRDFLTNRLYMPFAQANPMSVGTGLGLSIVRQLVTDIDGCIDIESELGYGTTVKVSVPLKPSDIPDSNTQSIGSTAMIRDIGVWCRDVTLCLVGFDQILDIEETPFGMVSIHGKRLAAVKESITTLARNWFGMRVTTAQSIAESEGGILLGLQSQINESEKMSRREALIVLEDVFKGSKVFREEGTFHLSQPVGPYKLARIIGLCLEYQSSFSDTTATPSTRPKFNRAHSYGFSQVLVGRTQVDDVTSPAMDTPDSDRTMVARQLSPKQTGETQISSYLKVESDESGTPRRTDSADVPMPKSMALLVEDNPINLKILVNHMNRAGETHTTAVNGLEALHKYQAGHKSFKIIFMDISMPVMDGISATRKIRQFENENSLPRVRIVALTCFSSDEYQKNAFEAGVDIFLVKPVLMKNLLPLLKDLDVVAPPRASRGC